MAAAWTRVAEGTLLAVALVGLVGSPGPRELPTALMQMPPAIVDAPYHSIASSPPPRVALVRRAGSGASGRHQQQLGLLAPPPLGSGSSRPPSWWYSKSRHWRSVRPHTHSMETPPLYQRKQPLPAPASPCFSDCVIDEDASLRRAHDWISRAAVNHQRRIEAIEAQEAKARKWADAIRTHLDSISGVMATSGVCFPTDNCATPAECREATTEEDCSARYGSWVPHDLDRLTQHANAYTADMKHQIDQVVQMAGDRGGAEIAPGDAPRDENMDLVGQDGSTIASVE